MIIPIITALANLAPTVIPLLTRNKTAATAAEAIANVSKAVTGTDTPEAALESLKGNAELRMEFQNMMNDHVVAMYEAENERLESVNRTIRAEVASDDPYVRRWRPTLGYIFSLGFGFMLFGLGYTIFTSPADVASVANALSNMGGVFAPVMAVLGISVWARSQDKKPAQTGILSAIAQRMLNGTKNGT